MLGNGAVHKILARFERRERTPIGSRPRAGGAREVARPHTIARRVTALPPGERADCGAGAYDTPGAGSASVFTPCHSPEL